MNLIASALSFFKKHYRTIQHACGHQLVGYHSLWTKPTNGQVQLEDFEILTLIVSALMWRKHNGPIWLYTDVPGLAWLQSHGLEHLYDKVRLMFVPTDIDPQVFWAAGKLQAYQLAPTPSVSIDLDAIIWQRLPAHMMLNDAMALHAEPRDWPSYSEAFVLQQFNATTRAFTDWHVDPVNTGVLLLNNKKLKDIYTSTAIAFMREYSATGERLAPYAGIMSPSTYTCVQEMIFAEQWLLTVCAKQLGANVAYMVDFDEDLDHIPRNELVSHLWNSKRSYRRHIKAKDTYCNYLLECIATQFPNEMDTLKSVGLSSIAEDANTGSLRFSGPGDWPLPGERFKEI